MIVHPSRVQSAVLHQYIASSFVALTRLPACQREDVWLLALRQAHVLRTHPSERRQRGGAMNIEGCGGACLTGQQSRALFAVAEEQRALKTRGV